ncbi:MAG: hypothetical protein DRI01_07270 [Chloroflexi bacterium]|nr:MAG: hypothetical protein DRI01_07270 [Chloroflexota bacterium]
MGYHLPESDRDTSQNSHSASLFDGLAREYDAWFDGEGRLIFSIEVQALRSLLPALPKPWLEIGVASGIDSVSAAN